MDRLRFREATADDAAAVLSIKRAAIRDIAGWTYDPEQIDAWAPDSDALPDFEAALSHERFSSVVAELEPTAAVVGYGVLDTADETIVAAYVHPDHTGEGIATSLLGQLEMRARMAGLDSVELAAAKNAASFYESLGYDHTGVEPLPIGDVDVEFAIMEKHLDVPADA